LEEGAIATDVCLTLTPKTFQKTMQKYSVNQHLIETILSWVKSDEIAIPEIQRPLVWNGAKVRDLMDSLYEEYQEFNFIT